MTTATNGSRCFITRLTLKSLTFAIRLVIRTGTFTVLNVIGVAPITRYSLVVHSGPKFRLISNVVATVIGVLKFVVFLRNVLK